jgi:predicted RNA binding protein YcfA (HicA-like mRNA interferase family)
MTTNELMQALQADGWYLVRQRGSHAILWHPTKSGQLTIAIHHAKEIPSSTVSWVLKKAGLE